MNRRTLLLGLSLALNVFLLALVGTHLVHATAPPAAALPQSPIDRMAAALSPDDAARFRAAVAARRPDFQPARDAVSAAHLAVAAAIGRVPYDADAMRSALQQWQASWRAFTARFDQAFLQAVSVLSDDGRARLAQAAIDEDAKRRRRDQQP
jgi:uncharacterized membrane protein